MLLFSFRRALILGLVLSAAVAANAQTQAPAPAAPKSGPKPVIRAHALPGGLKLDGRLDEEAYKTVPGGPYTFIQQEPAAGQPATEKTEFWVFYDNKNLYFSFRMWDSHPERILASEMRHDQGGEIYNNENISVILDPFHDGRSGYYIMTNPLGALRDVQFQSETQANNDWNPVWNPRAARFDGGWTVEIALPFKSIRYPSGSAEQTWGFNLRRMVRWKNEVSYLTAMPPSIAASAVYRLSEEATLTGIKVPPSSRTLDITPYVSGRTTTDRVVKPPYNNKLDGDVGADVKVGITQGITADFTYNTDFAQVEDDLAQVNLTRFGVFFPEKRAFFLEGQSIFDFGGASSSTGSGDIPTLFFSRQIGLAAGAPIPVLGGGRVTGKAGAFTIGALDIETQEDSKVKAPATNFGVVRLRRDVLKKSYVGVIATSRNPSEGRDNNVIGADTVLGFGLTNVTAYIAKSSTPGREGNDLSYLGGVNYNADRYGVVAQRLVVEQNFNPEMGFMRRSNFRSSTANLRFSPRPKRGGTHFKPFRKFTYQTNNSYLTDNTGRLQSRSSNAAFNFDLNNGATFASSVNKDYEDLVRPFQVNPAARIPVGGYGFTHFLASFAFPTAFRVRGTVSTDLGQFYNGTKRTVGYSGRAEVTKQIIIEPTISLNWVKLPVGNFTTHLVQSRVTYTVSPRLSFGTLVQYNQSAHTFSTNTRLAWEYIPGSNFYVVYTEGRTTAIPDRWAELQNRTFVVKLTKLLRY